MSTIQAFKKFEKDYLSKLINLFAQFGLLSQSLSLVPSLSLSLSLSLSFFSPSYMNLPKAGLEFGSLTSKLSFEQIDFQIFSQLITQSSGHRWLNGLGQL